MTPTPDRTPDWQPIETAPRIDRERVLLWWPHWARHAIVGYWRHGYWIAEEALSDSDYVPPTHWMPLPTPPGGAPMPPTNTPSPAEQVRAIAAKLDDEYESCGPGRRHSWAEHLRAAATRIEQLERQRDMAVAQLNKLKRHVDNGLVSFHTMGDGE